ncbi:acyltransferase [Lacrimispora sp. BS-2]|uniref:Acyltransferase n=1 Tax=Lacrimispora sp. BS-2 TaxID=3151850 RepID=A0AAU7PRG8_9FIRM
MGKLQMTILAFIAISCGIHIRRQLKDRDYLKHLFLGNDSGKSRILYLDYVRLIAALFVILVHCLDFSTAGLTAGSKTWVGVQSLSSILLVCNTLFIMNSGALILREQKESLPAFYYKRFLQVALPFFCYYCIYILLSCRYFNSGLMNGILKALKDMAAGPIDWAPHLWVIYVILSLYILAPFFSILLRHLTGSMLHGLAVLILLFRCLAVYLPVIGLPLNFELMISPWEGVFLLGYYFSKPISMKYRKAWLGLGMVSFLFTILCTALRPDYKAILLAEGAPAMILLGASVFLMLRSLENRLPRPGMVMNFLIRHSYSILLVHWAVLYFVRERSGINWLSFGMAGSTLLSFILVLVLSSAAAFLFDQTIVLCVQTLFKGLVHPLRSR